MSTVPQFDPCNSFEVRLFIPGWEPIHEPEPLRVFDPSPEPVKPVQAVAEVRSLVQLYDDLCSESDKEKRVSMKTISDNRHALNRFQRWMTETGRATGNSPVQLLLVRHAFRDFAMHIRQKPKGNSAAMAVKEIGVLKKLANACHRAGLISSAPESVPRSIINMMRPRTEQQRLIKGVPVTLAELKSMLECLDGCTWPRIGKVSPAKFWEVCLLSHFLYGFRSQDWFAARTNLKPGLLWSGVKTQTECPVVEGLHNPAGWVVYLVNKTKNKDESADRSPYVVVPLNARMRELIELFRGADSERVFPMSNNSRRFSEELQYILEGCGLCDRSRDKAGRPRIRLSMGVRAVASFRKGCAAYWAKVIGAQASSYLLHHATQQDNVSRTTTEFYLQGFEILSDITAKIEEFPL